MSVQAHNCRPDRIAGFLDHSLSDSELEALEDHLGDCPACRKLLGDQTAPAELWDKASRYLRDDRSEADPLPGANGLSPAQDRSHAIQAVLDSLCPTDDPEMLGRLGGLEVGGIVGAGAMGVVLKAFDKSLDRTVAVKVLAPHLALSGAARRRFAREAKAAAAVLHPNVMAIHSVSNDESLPYLVMPYCRGASLQKRLDQEGPLPLTEILRIGTQLAAGVAAAHAQGLVHRDIKPANILLEEGVERVAITDFGLARAVDDATMTHTSVIAGTPQYMSPEQARGESVEQRSDLFSLGSVLYAMCTGRSPFRAETSYGVLRRITDDEPRPIREINPDIPEWFCAIVATLMSKRPEDRFESAEQLAELLEECLAHVQQPTTVPLPASNGHRPPSSTGPRQRWPGAKILVGLAIVFVLIVASVLVVLELNKGKLTIQCDTDSVPVRITQRDKVVEEMVVSRDAKSVRIAAGRYKVELLTESDGFIVKDGTFTLTRGQEHVVTISRVPPRTPEARRAVSSPKPAVEPQGRDALQISGILKYDERQMVNVHTRVPARIEEMHVDYSGVEVKKGDPLATLHSGEFYSAEEEFLQAYLTNESQSDPKSAQLLETTREKLRLLGVNNEQIDELAKRNKASGRLTLFAPCNGIVTAIEAKEGASINRDARLVTIADPTRLWARLYVNESHIGWFRFKHPVTLTAHAYPGQTFPGKVLFIEPTIDPETRSLVIRVEVPNPQSKLKPGMSVSATIQRPASADSNTDIGNPVNDVESGGVSIARNTADDNSTYSVRSASSFQSKLSEAKSELEWARRLQMKGFQTDLFVEGKEKQLSILRAELEAQLHLLKLEVKDSQRDVAAATKHLELIKESVDVLPQTKLIAAQEAVDAAKLRLQRAQTLLDLYDKIDKGEAAEREPDTGVPPSDARAVPGPRVPTSRTAGKERDSCQTTPTLDPRR